MRVITENERAGARVVALGTFDGVHMGHRELILRGKAMAEALGARLRVCTFDRHPLEILNPGRAPRRLETAEEQAARMEELGVDELRVIPFTRETADTEPEDFLRQLEEECEIRALTAGWNYTFGKKGRGNPELLQREGLRAGFRVEIIPPVRTPQGEVISSTAIRDRLMRGDLEGANCMLGYSYRITGRAAGQPEWDAETGLYRIRIETEARKQLPANGDYGCELNCGGMKLNAGIRIADKAGAQEDNSSIELRIPGEITIPEKQVIRIELTDSTVNRVHEQ